MFVLTVTASTFVPHDPSKDHRTVFVSNLSYDVDEDQVKEVLNPAGKVEEIRLVRNFKGQSKGYGYIVFSTDVRYLQHLTIALRV